MADFLQRAENVGAKKFDMIFNASALALLQCAISRCSSFLGEKLSPYKNHTNNVHNCCARPSAFIHRLLPDRRAPFFPRIDTTLPREQCAPNLGKACAVAVMGSQDRTRRPFELEPLHLSSVNKMCSLASKR